MTKRNLIVNLKKFDLYNEYVDTDYPIDHLEFPSSLPEQLDSFEKELKMTNNKINKN